VRVLDTVEGLNKDASKWEVFVLLCSNIALMESVDELMAANRSHTAMVLQIAPLSKDSESHFLTLAYLLVLRSFAL
jgi:hypothetical protein